MVLSIKERIEKNYKDREKNNDKRKELRKKLNLPNHANGKKRLKMLLSKVRKRECSKTDAFNFIIRERADSGYQGEIRGLNINYELGRNLKKKVVKK